ncbi:hypothetical protein ABZ816_18960 [Actinosynnema sp. NPDC047251]|uniref:hypothetical protein n=1 Tax=Saccharothrix espanaensis TaxID=103731 RepID=UPI00059BB08E|nr:hypothetical protein [Saccharothrix espanaensis]
MGAVLSVVGLAAAALTVLDKVGLLPDANPVVVVGPTPRTSDDPDPTAATITTTPAPDPRPAVRITSPVDRQDVQREVDVWGAGDPEPGRSLVVGVLSGTDYYVLRSAIGNADGSWVTESPIKIGEQNRDFCVGFAVVVLSVPTGQVAGFQAANAQHDQAKYTSAALGARSVSVLHSVTVRRQAEPGKTCPR